MLSSSIESMYGGAVNVRCGGEIDVGSALVPSASVAYPLGIVSLWGGNINVIADGDINVDGSRIAAYDGGNIFVESLNGNVNAGIGGKGSVTVYKPYVNKNGQVVELEDIIQGSGILATSFPQLVPGAKSEQVGNITVETPEGNIVASKGGIAQLALGPVAHNDATIDLSAGRPGLRGQCRCCRIRRCGRPGEHFGHGEHQWFGGGQRGGQCERPAKRQRDSLVARRGHRERGRDGQRDHCGRWQR